MMKINGRTIGIWSLVFSGILLLVSFITPPTGIIDGSVLKAVGEILGFVGVIMIPDIISSGKKVRVEKNGFKMEVEDDNSKEK